VAKRTVDRIARPVRGSYGHGMTDMDTEQFSTGSQQESPPDNVNRLILCGAGLSLMVLLGLICWLYQGPGDVSIFGALHELVYAVLAVGLIVAFLLGYRALRASSDSSRVLPIILGFGLTFSVLGIFSQPVHSLDVFGYINTGRLQVHYGINPYIKIPAEAPGWRQDPMFHEEWLCTHAPYGFLFTEITRIPCWLGHGDPITTLLLFKAMNVLAFGLTGWVVWLGCRRLGLPHPERALYLLLWNPLLLFHGIADCHNDLLMALLTATGVYFAMRGAWMWVLPAIMAGALIKLGSAVVLPFAFLYLVKCHGWRKALASAGLALLMGIVLAVPYLTTAGGMSDWRRFVENATATHNSLASLLYFPFEVSLKPFPWLQPYESLVMVAIKLVFWIAFITFYGNLAWRRVSGGRYTRFAFVRDCLLLHFALICLVSSKYYVWYIGMFFPLALWVNSDDWLHRAVVALSCAQVLSLTFVEQSHALNVIVMLIIPLAWAVPAGTFRVPNFRFLLPRFQFFSLRTVAVHK
jgi:hypothetical protein